MYKWCFFYFLISTKWTQKDRVARLLLAVFHKMTTGLRHSSTEPTNLQIDRLVDTMTKKNKSPLPPAKTKNAGTASESVSFSIVPDCTLIANIFMTIILDLKDWKNSFVQLESY